MIPKKMLRPDAKGRITLGSLAIGVSGFVVTETKDHNLLLEPYAEIPMRERWLFDNKAALEQVEMGIKDAAAGRISKRGSFAKFVDEEDTE